MNVVSLSKRFIARTLLCATIIVLSAQGQNARISRTSSGPAAGNSVITCMPGLVLRCNQFGCFCVKP
jgi:hypothetical protein